MHREIIENIEAVGLKRPITVSRRKSAAGEDRYDLICGQGRMEAFQALGERIKKDSQQITNTAVSGDTTEIGPDPRAA